MKELVIRTISGSVFVILTLASLVIAPSNPIPFVVLFSLYLMRTVYEYLRLTLGKSHVAQKVVGICASLLVFLIGAYFGAGAKGMSVMWFLCIFAIMLLIVLSLLALILDLFAKDSGGVVYVWSSFLYIGIPFALLAMMADFIDGYSGWKIASLLIIMWSGDVGAYCIGTAFGQGKNGHKLMPSVSPKKSWEGVFGALVFSMASAIILRACGVLLPAYGFLLSTLFGFLVCVASILGDLAESKLKRKFQVKDSGKIMPGHGGFLDRFDSGLVAFPVAALFYFLVFFFHG